MIRKRKFMVLGLLGESKSGKDFISTALEKDLKDFTILKFKAADILKLRVEKEFPEEFSINKWETLGDEYRECIVPKLGMSRRKLLQTKGDEYLLKDPMYVHDYITHTCTAEYKKFLSDKNGKNGHKILVLFTDIRLQKEVDAIKWYGSIVKITRPLHERYFNIWKEYLDKAMSIGDDFYNTTKRLSPREISPILKLYINQHYPHIYKKFMHKSESSVNNISKEDILLHIDSSTYEKSYSKLINIIQQK